MLCHRVHCGVTWGSMLPVDDDGRIIVGADAKQYDDEHDVDDDDGHESENKTNESDDVERMPSSKRRLT